MNETKQEQIGYAAIIYKKNGGFSYMGTDSHSGGYPYFTANPVIRGSLLHAAKDAECLKKMKSYYGSGDHDFNKVVVCTVFLQTIPSQDLKENSDFMLKEKLRANFSEEEIKKLKNVL